VAAPICRAKNDKVDVTWTPVAGAAFYRVSRAQPGAAPVLVGEVSGNVLADFGLPLEVAQQYSVASVSPTGAVSAASEVCNVTPRGRADGNRAPVFTSEPLTSAIERHNWYLDLTASDPDGDAVSFSLVTAPPGMRLNGPALVTWIPGTEQIGPHVVELRATDARGAYGSQAFSIDVADYNEPPQITSVPISIVEAGQSYQYDVEAFDPEGAALRFSFAGPAPAGMSIDPASGVVAWSPAASDVGGRTIAVRAADSSGAFDEQSFPLDVFSGALDLLAPKGEFEIEVGEALDLEIRANQPAARFYVLPLPRGATATGGRIRWTPAEDQVGQYSVAVKAKLGSVFDLERIAIRVTRPNRPPSIADPGPQTVPEGGELVVELVTSDPDGDVVSVAPNGALPANALLDDVAKRLVFRPSYEQAGELSVAIAASDGTASSEVIVPIEVIEREPPIEFSELVIDRLQSPTLQPRARISGNVVGDAAGDPEPEAFVAVNGLSPAAGKQGRTLDVAITGLNTEFSTGQTAASFGEGIAVESLEILSPTSARARIAIASAAALGTRVVTLSGNGPAAASIVAFVVEPGAIVFSGQLVDSFTQQPIAGARVAINGTLFEGETDADGRFSIAGVPPGPQQIVVLRNDYDIERIDMIFEQGRDLALEEPVELDALARPFQAGGSLPRAANVASILDRGLAGGEQPLTQEQAEALIEDTLIVVGGTLVGVFDEAGEQLNPQVEGVGFLSLTREGVAAQARALLLGQRLTLREIGGLLTTAFDWGAAPPDAAALVAMLQRFADAAWAEPGDPRNAMAFVLLNEGTTLLSRPPRVTPETTLNRFQASLLVTSLLLPSIYQLEKRADEQLRLRGIDPSTIGAHTLQGGSLSAARLAVLGRGVARVLEWIAPAAARAQGGTGEVILGPNTNVEADFFSGQTFTRMRNHAWRNFYADLTVGNLINAGIQTAIKAGIALAIGSTGGINGITLAGAFIASLGEGAVMSVLEKLALGYVIAAAADSIEPSPPLPERSFVDTVNEKLVIEFSPSVSEQEGDLRQHSYELFEFPAPNSTDIRDATMIDVATLSVSQRDPSKLQFAIPLAVVRAGVHYYRMATIQYLRASAVPLEQARTDYSYSMLPAADGAPSQISDFQKPFGDWTNYVKGHYGYTEIERLATQSALRNEIQSRYGTLTNPFEGQLQKSDIQIAALERERVSLHGSIDAQQRAFKTEAGKQIDKVENLTRYATGRVPGHEGIQPEAFRDPNSRQAQTVLETMDYYRPGDTYRPEVGERLEQIAVNQELVDEYSRRAGVHSQGVQKLEELREGIASGQVAPSAPKPQIETYDAAGRAVELELDLPDDPAAATARLDAAIALEREKIDLSNQIARDAEGEITSVAEDLKRVEVPEAPAHERAMSEKMAQGAELDAQKRAAEIERRELTRQNRKFRQEVGHVQRQRSDQFENAKPKYGPVVGALNVVGGLAQAAGEINDIYEGTRLVYSDFSPPFRYTHTLRTVQPFAIEVDPNIYHQDGVVIGRKGERYIDANTGRLVDESRNGWLRTAFLDTGENDDESSAGFPPEFLAVDSIGRIYAHNGNSATRFGGRIFRFDPANGLAREFVGTVNYYSTLIQYGKPASPVAMATGRVDWDGRALETLFVADVEQVGMAGVALEQPKPVIKHLPIALLESGEAYHAAGSRSHFVGQPFVEDARFRFTGPTDMVALDRPGDEQRLYLSDEECIYVIRHSLGGGAREVIELLCTAGAQWSGLAFDLAPSPNFYFAEYRTGFVYTVSSQDLIAAESGSSLAEFAVPLGALQYGGSVVQPYDIEIDQRQRRIVGTSALGVFAMQIPVVRRNDPDDPVLFVKRLGREFRGRLIQGLNGLVYRVLPITEFEQLAGRVRVIARDLGAIEGATTREYDVSLAPAGPTEVELLP
jgi:hypothetical protein